MANLLIRPRIPSPTTYLLLTKNIIPFAGVIQISIEATMLIIQRLSEQGIIGRVCYDTLIAQAAINEKLDGILTNDLGDCRRVIPDYMHLIQVPS